MNPLLDHLRNSYKNGTASVLPWTEKQKEGHKYKIGAVVASILDGAEGKGGDEGVKGVLKAALVDGDTGAGKGNSTAASGGVLKAAVTGFDAWPASIQMIVQRESPAYLTSPLSLTTTTPTHRRLTRTAKGNAQSGYSPNSLAILQAQSARGDDQDQVTHSSGTIAAQSVDYSVFSVDTGYIADITVGSAGKAYSMLIDTGS